MFNELNSTTILSILGVIAGVITALFGGSGAKWIEGKLGITNKRYDELMEVRKSLIDRVTHLEAHLAAKDKIIEERDKVIDDWQQKFYTEENKRIVIENKLNEYLEDIKQITKIVSTLVTEVNRLREKVGEPPLIIEGLIKGIGNA